MLIFEIRFANEITRLLYDEQYLEIYMYVEYKFIGERNNGRLIGGMRISDVKSVISLSRAGPMACYIAWSIACHGIRRFENPQI